MMKLGRFIILAALLAAAGTSDIAHARDGRHTHHARARTHIGVYVGPSVGWSWRYPGPYAYPSYGYPSYAYPPYYYPYPSSVVVVPATPPTYIERSLPEEAQPAVPPSSDWYYHCRDPEGYYPYVPKCPGGWQKVPAQPQQ